ncbi:hypothetical protein [Pedobacter sp. UYP30]|uniref:hypothetical protein n=1 Tax=Pedobacter sp. UYP30 TaxID=1756400 RepID=UPI003396CE0F
MQTAIGDAIADGWDKKVVHGTTEERSEVAGQVIEGVLEAAVGTKGAGAVVKGVTSAGKFALGAERIAAITEAIAKLQKAMKLEKLLGKIKGIFKVGRKESLVNIGLFKRYIKSIEEFTGRKLNPKQIEEIKKALRANKYEKLTPEENLLKRKEFNNKKKGLIKEWEKQTGQEWPKYDEVILDKNGKPYRNVGDQYDAHHVMKTIMAETTNGGIYIPQNHQVNIRVEFMAVAHRLEKYSNNFNIFIL